jgi:hypothetical protein
LPKILHCRSRCDIFFTPLSLINIFLFYNCLRRSDDEEFNVNSDSDDEDEEYEEQDESENDQSAAVKTGDKRKVHKDFFFLSFFPKLSSSTNLPITYISILCYPHLPF